MIKLKELLEEPIPKYLFHATFNALIPNISSKGIVPGGEDYVNFEGIEKGVYLSNKADFAGSMVQNTENKNIPEEWFDEIVICVIDTTKLDPRKFDIDPNIAPQEDEYDDTIPADTTVYSYIYKGIIPFSAITEIVDYEG
jgi:hypothetical protein